jgi:DNA-binding HxlR family transcriptional regulator
MSDPTTAKLLHFFNALADENRFKIVGVLAQGDYSVEELAEMLGLKPSTISHHLNKLGKAGLVSARAESYYNIYHLNTEMLALLSKSINAEETLNNAAADIDLDAYDKKVVHDYSNADGSLKDIPAQVKKLQAVLRYVVQVFEPERQYSEPEVNQALAKYHADTATLRRELIGMGLLERDAAGKKYWRG